MTEHLVGLKEELNLKGELTTTVTRGAESWQFFAFVFAALVTLALSVLDEVPIPWLWRIGAKLLAFLGFDYLVLIDVWVRNWLVGVLGLFKQERQ